MPLRTLVLVPWVFHKDKHVNAGNLWTGIWSEVGANKVSVAIAPDKGAKDTFEIVFVSPKWFVGIKNGEIYRVGKRL